MFNLEYYTVEFDGMRFYNEVFVVAVFLAGSWMPFIGRSLNSFLRFLNRMLRRLGGYLWSR